MTKRIFAAPLLIVAVYLLFQDEIILGTVLFMLGGFLFSSSFSDAPIEYSDADFSSEKSFGDGGGE